MIMKRLPPIAPENESKAARAPGDQPTGWDNDGLTRWLNNDRLAEWVPELIRRLGQRFGDNLPPLLGQALVATPEDDPPAWCCAPRARPDWLARYLGSTDPDGARLWLERGFLQDDPAWLERLLALEKDRVARSFLVTGNIADYAFDPVYGYRPASRLLIERLLERKDCVLSFRLSQGLTAYSLDDHGQVSRAIDSPVVQGLPGPIKDELSRNGHPGREAPLLSDICRRIDVLGECLTSGYRDQGVDEDVGSQAPVAILLENLNLLIPADGNDIDRNYLIDALLHWSSSPELGDSQHCMVMMAESLEDIGNELRTRGGRIEQIEIARPRSVDARMKFLLAMLGPAAPMPDTRISARAGSVGDLTGYAGAFAAKRERLARDTAGMTLIGIEDMLQQAQSSSTRALDRKRVMELKRERLRQESEGLLEVVDPRRTLADIGGYDRIKLRLSTVIQALSRPDDAALRRTCPMGILFLGPPGTGKSIMAEAIAGESGISMAKLGDFRGMYVGQSERNLSRILALIESLHPVIVFIDEIDQALGMRAGPGGDGGVDRRIFGRFLEFMSDTRHRGEILWVGASNQPHAIDSAMKRPGRFDLALPFLLPDEHSRSDILATLLARQERSVAGLVVALSNDERHVVAAETNGFSGAELEMLVNEALYRAAHARPTDSAEILLDLPLFQQVMQDYSPPPGQRAHYEEMTQHAIDAVSFIDLLPDPYRSRRRQAHADEAVRRRAEAAGRAAGHSDV
jgi:transitional endoplasmic reticulum ATPase